MADKPTARDPWEPVVPADREPWESAPAASPDYLSDIGRSAAGAALRTPLHPLGLIGDISQGTGTLSEWIARKIGVNPQIFEVAKRLEAEHKLLGSRGAPSTMDLARLTAARTGLPADYTGETFPGRLTGGVVEGALNPVNLAMGPGGIVARAVTGGISGAGSEIGEEVAGPVGSVVGSLGGSIAAGSRIDRAAARAAQSPAPTADELRAALGTRDPGGKLRFKSSDVPKMQANEQAARLSDHLDKTMDAIARHKGGNKTAALKNQLNKIIDNKEKFALTPEQEAGLRKIIDSNPVLESLAGITSHAWMPGLGIGGGVLEMVMSRGHDPWGALAAITAGIALRRGPAALARRAAFSKTEQLRQNILRTAPSGGGKLPPLPPRLDPAQVPAAVIRDLTGSNEEPDGKK